MLILFCGLSEYPDNKSASINRYTSIAKAMQGSNEIIFINRIKKVDKDSENKGKAFSYIDVCKTSDLERNIFKRNFRKIYSLIFEFIVFYRLAKKRKIDWVNVYTQYFTLCIFYFLLSKIFKFKTIFHYVELRSKSRSRPFYFKINDLLFDRFVSYLFDYYVPISHYLNNRLKYYNAECKSIIIPPICDFDAFDKLQIVEKELCQYFLFCGSSAYEDVINFVIDSYLKSNAKKTYSLYLVINGDLNNQLVSVIAGSSGKIKLFSNLDYDKLISLYKQSIALLIPLKKNLQDQARFPNKIGEYLASRKLIITTNEGEIKNYFKDKINALVSNDVDTISYAACLDWFMENQVDKISILKESYQTGRMFFDLKSYMEPLESILKDNV